SCAGESVVRREVPGLVVSLRIGFGIGVREPALAQHPHRVLDGGRARGVSPLESLGVEECEIDLIETEADLGVGHAMILPTCYQFCYRRRNDRPSRRTAGRFREASAQLLVGDVYPPEAGAHRDAGEPRP